MNEVIKVAEKLYYEANPNTKKMATIGKKKYQKIKEVSVIHKVLKEQWKSDAEFLNYNPDLWSKEQKEVYDLLITHEMILKEEIEKILENRQYY